MRSEEQVGATGQIRQLVKINFDLRVDCEETHCLATALRHRVQRPARDCESDLAFRAPGGRQDLASFGKVGHWVWLTRIGGDRPEPAACAETKRPAVGRPERSARSAGPYHLARLEPVE